MLHRVEMRHVEALVQHRADVSFGLQDVVLNVPDETFFVTSYGF